jgi:N-acetylmuramoyl-L-alanine amidase
VPTFALYNEDSMRPEATGMVHVHDIKRRLLQEAVQENAGRRPPPVPGPRQKRRPVVRSWPQRVLAVVLPVILLLVAYGLSMVPEAQRGLASLAVLVPPRPAVQHDSLSPDALPAPSAVDWRVFPLGVRRIVLDPGHGGEDAGAVAPLGIVEKDVTLDIGQRLRRLLEQASFEVVMTREVDETVPLAQRAVLANTRGADVFVSIHANWFPMSVARGAETYYLGPTDNPQALQLAALENRHSGYSLGDYRRLLESVYLEVRRAESYQLASAIQHELARSLHKFNPTLRNRGVKMAPFLVLVATSMPAVLAEVAYLSNHKEARLLATPEYRQRIAQALFQGIRAYADTLNQHATKKGS